MNSTANVFDRVVGTIAGAIYGDLATRFHEPPLMLIPPITFKVRKILEHFTDIRLLTSEQRAVLADDIRTAIVPMLFMYELDAREIEEMGPVIESAALAALNGEKE
jgi:hypothetical protein